MGGLNPLSILKGPKIPKPEVVQPLIQNNQATSADATAEAEAERRRRAAASGTTGNIVSTLAGAPSDSMAQSRRTLLGG